VIAACASTHIYEDTNVLLILPLLESHPFCDYRDIHELLKPSNIEVDELYEYATEAAEWFTHLQLKFSVSTSAVSRVVLIHYSWSNHNCSNTTQGYS